MNRFDHSSPLGSRVESKTIFCTFGGGGGVGADVSVGGGVGEGVGVGSGLGVGDGVTWWGVGLKVGVAMIFGVEVGFATSPFPQPFIIRINTITTMAEAR